MKLFQKLPLAALTAVAMLLVGGCGQKDDAAKKSEKAEAHGEAGGHEEEEASGGASFKKGKGVILTDEVKQILKVEIADVADRQLPNQISLSVQLFDEKHRARTDAEDHSGCDVHGSGLLSAAVADGVKAGFPVTFQVTSNGPSASGIVIAVQKAAAIGESEVVVGVSNAPAGLKPGSFVSARINAPRTDPVTAIPDGALLRTSEGTFAYVVNGDAFFRTAVKVGAEAEGWAEITDGLLPGDQVVTKPVQTLWLIELRATKGGGHSH